MWLLVIREQLILEKEPANPHDEFAVAVIKDSHIGAAFRKFIHRSHGILLHKGALSSVVLLGERGKEKAYSLLASVPALSYRCMTYAYLNSYVS